MGGFESFISVRLWSVQRGDRYSVSDGIRDGLAGQFDSTVTHEGALQVHRGALFTRLCEVHIIILQVDEISLLLRFLQCLRKVANVDQRSNK